ncbi:lipid-A-disaccharide synthase [bacterium]|nr:lipid-A-disaccharide synthase [bacterium]
MLKIMFVAGEASGDLHASRVAAKIKELIPEASLFGMGGDLMLAAGVDLEYNIADSAVMGFSEVLSSIPALWKKLTRLKEIVVSSRPDALVLIDFPDFNMRLARYAHKLNIPVIYYIPPKAWAWRRYRARQIAQITTVVASIFPFEAEFYRRAGANVKYVGHPLLDFAKSAFNQREAKERFSLNPDEPVFGLMPGSRRKEVDRLLPVMLEVAHRIHEIIPTCQFLLPLAPTISKAGLPEMPFVQVIEGEVYNIMRACDLMCIASGTATLEAALMLTPMIIIYKVSFSTWIILNSLVRLTHSGLPNIIAGREIVQELLQSQANPQLISKIAIELLSDPNKIARQKAELAKIREQLGTEGAVERIAKLVLKVAMGENDTTDLMDARRLNDMCPRASI